MKKKTAKRWIVLGVLGLLVVVLTACNIGYIEITDLEGKDTYEGLPVYQATDSILTVGDQDYVAQGGRGWNFVEADERIGYIWSGGFASGVYILTEDPEQEFLGEIGLNVKSNPNLIWKKAEEPLQIPLPAADNVQRLEYHKYMGVKVGADGMEIDEALNMTKDAEVIQHFFEEVYDDSNILTDERLSAELGQEVLEEETVGTIIGYSEQYPAFVANGFDVVKLINFPEYNYMIDNWFLYGSERRPVLVSNEVMEAIMGDSYDSK